MYYSPKGFIRALISCALLAPASAQHQHGPASEKPVTLLPGLGIHHYRIRTADPEAQKFFDQGLRLLYGFDRYEALRSFRKASELDPHALMPHWGVAMATGPHINMDVDGDVDMKASCEAVENGRRLKDRAPDHERAWLEAAAARCPEFDASRYIRAMRKLAAEYPDDLEAATLLAEALMIPVRWRWWTRDGKPAEGTEEAVRILEIVLRRNPDHPGANHFFIHAVESSPSPERAIPNAQRLMGLVPRAGHLVHMPGHIWLLLGDYELAASVDARLAENAAASLPHWQRAVELQDHLVYDEPPACFYPVRESLGAALLRAGRPAEAEAVFREGLYRSPRNGRMLFGLVESLRAQGKDHAAAMVATGFESAWSRADVKLRLEDY